MAAPDFTGPLQGLKVLDITDIKRYKAAVEAGGKMGWGYYFPYLLSRNRPERSAVLLAEDEDSICIYLWSSKQSQPRLDVYVAPTPMNTAALARCLERANDFNGDRTAKVMRIDAEDATASAAAGLRVRPRRSQYIFSPDAYTDIGGKKFYTVRRNANLVAQMPDVEVLPYSPVHAQACHALLDRWQSMHREIHGTNGGVGTSRRAIDLAGVLPASDLQGEIVMIDGSLAAFAFGGEIRPGLAASFERKSDTNIRGLSYFHFRSFLKSMQPFDLINDGSDTGRPGLRQLKDSFRPVAMHTEYRGSQRSA